MTGRKNWSNSKPGQWSRQVLGIAVLLLALALPANALAHGGHEHGERAPADGRIPGEPDFKKLGDTTYRFLPDQDTYKITRPGEPAQWMHADPLPSSSPLEPAVGGWVPLPTNELAPVCRNWGNRIIINYDGPSPVPVGTLRSLVQRMNWKIANQSSLSSGGSRVVRMAVECDASGQIAIYNYSLEQAHAKFGSPQGANAVKVLTYQAGGVSGGGPISMDNVKSRQNGNAQYTAYPWMTQGSNGWESHNPMHELFHSMGATQGTGVTPKAPFSTAWTGTNGFHCVDGWDVMCYEDGGGGEFGPYTETRCPASAGYNTATGVPLDCGTDTYFDAAAAPGSYLANYWNVGEPENPYLTVPAGVNPSAETWTPATRKAQPGLLPEVDLRGRVSPYGDYATYWFEWGSTTSYGSKTAMGDAGWGTNPRTVSTKLVGGFNREQLYHFRVVVRNDAGAVYGQDLTFEAKDYFADPTSGPRWPTDDLTTEFADVNGDGKDDIVGRSAATGDRQVGLSTGSAFSPPTSWGIWGAGSDFTFVLADVNGDGKDDTVGREGAGQVRVGLSTGTTFAASTQWTNWPTSETIQFADVNGDGKDDIIGRNSTTGERRVGLSTGSSFAAPISWGIWGAGSDFSFVAADVNGDGKADSVGRNGAGEVRVGLSTGTTFSAWSQWGTFSTEYAIVFRDVNGDGSRDIVGRHTTNGDRRIALSTGSAFGASTSWGAWSPDFAFNLLIRDVNGDGKADSVGRSSTGEVRVGLSTGTAFSTWNRWTTWSAEYTLVVEDVNGDGRDDMVRHYPSTGDRHVSLASGSSFAAATAWGPAWDSGFGLSLADVNGDGKADSAGRNAAGEVRVGLSTGTTFAASSLWTTFSTEYAIVFRDVNGDGKDDIVGRHTTNGDRRVALSTGSSFGAASSWGAWSPDFAFDLIVRDVNGDGKADSVGRNAAGEVRVGLSTGTTFAASSLWATFSTEYWVTYADINGDGKADIVGRNASGERMIRLSTGSSFGNQAIWGNPWTPAELGLLIRDVNGDKRADSVGLNSSTGEVYVGLSKGP